MPAGRELRQIVSFFIMEILLLVDFGIRHNDCPNIRILSTLILATGVFKSERGGDVYHAIRAVRRGLPPWRSRSNNSGGGSVFQLELILLLLSFPNHFCRFSGCSKPIFFLLFWKHDWESGRRALYYRGESPIFTGFT